MSDDLIKVICEKEHILPCTIRRLSGGQMNEIYLVNEEYVIRAGIGPDGSGRMRAEAALLSLLKNLAPVPEVYSTGECLGITYQVQGFIEGERLTHTWHPLSLSEKDRIIVELTKYARAFHSISYRDYGWLYQDKRYASWPAFWEGEYASVIEEAAGYSNGLPPDILRLAASYFTDHKDVLQDCPSVLCHHDLWPGNILVASGHIMGILDLEFAKQAPIEDELITIEQFCLYPNDYIEGDGGAFTTSDFVDYFHLLRKHYPEMFSCPSLRQRLDIYHIHNALWSFVNWRRRYPDYDHVPMSILARIYNFLFENGIRLFR
jgi:aminoglycoside phosphotransferase (APT) family kinase protein